MEQAVNFGGRFYAYRENICILKLTTEGEIIVKTTPQNMKGGRDQRSPDKRVVYHALCSDKE